MTKPIQFMRCCICGRPLARAAALKGGLPVGPVCAASAGLVAPRGAKAKGPQRELDLAPAPAVERDSLTIDMFA